MRKGRKFVVAMAAALFVSAVPTTAFGNVTLYDYSKTGTSSSKESKSSISDTLSKVKALVDSGAMSLKEIGELGPGYAAAVEEYVKEAAENTAKELGIVVNEVLGEQTNAGFSGPSVTQVSLGQVYHAEYKTYELSMGDQFFIYSNVGNGAMTHEPVVVDLPANVAYTVEKDGLPYEYHSQQYIFEKGTYVMKLMGIVNKDAPLSEQKEYQATFRFRIQDPPPVEETEAAVNGGGTSSGSDNSGASAMWNDVTTGVNDQIPDLSQIGSLIQNGGKTEQETVAAAEETKAAESTEAAPETEVTAPVIAEHSEREQRFELATGNYVITLENGMELTSSVPEGYVGSASVTLCVSEGDEVVTKLYKNDSAIEFVNDSAITEFGRYRVEMDGYSYFFTLADAVSDMSVYPAPAGMEFTEARLDNELLTLVSDQYVEMPEDGTYSFVMKGAHGERYEVTLVKDNVAPEVNVTVNKSTAAIQYVSKDIKTIELVKDGNPVSGFRGTSIGEPGKYVLTVYDAAGNSTQTSFSLKYQINLYGVLAVLLVILTAAGVVAFTIYTKKNTKVR